MRSGGGEGFDERLEVGAVADGGEIGGPGRGHQHRPGRSARPQPGRRSRQAGAHHHRRRRPVHFRRRPAGRLLGTFPVTWSGTDDGSGVRSHTVWVSDEDGPFAVWLADTDLTTAEFTGFSGHTYAFHVVSTDNVGNRGTASAQAATRVNSEPTLGNVADATTAEDTPTPPIAFTVGDAELAAADLVVTAASSDLALVPAANLLLGGSGADRTLTVTPIANRSGAVTITLSVSDGVYTVTDTFTLNVAAVNDTPTLPRRCPTARPRRTLCSPSR